MDEVHLRSLTLLVFPLYYKPFEWDSWLVPMKHQFIFFLAGLIGLFCGRAKITISTAYKHVVCEMVCHLLELWQFLEELPQMGRATLREHT